MATVSVHEAKARLSELLRRAEAGEEFTITRHGEKIAQLSGIADRSRTQPGLGAGTVQFHGDFEFTADEIDEFYRADIDPND